MLNNLVHFPTGLDVIPGSGVKTSPGPLLALSVSTSSQSLLTMGRTPLEYMNHSGTARSIQMLDRPSPTPLSFQEKKKPSPRRIFEPMTMCESAIVEIDLDDSVPIKQFTHVSPRRRGLGCRLRCCHRNSFGSTGLPPTRSGLDDQIELTTEIECDEQYVTRSVWRALDG
jgi:hypothetical protein